MGMPEPRTMFFSSEHGLIVRRAPRDAVPYAVFQGVPPTPRQVKEVASRGYGIHFMGSNSDLRFLSEVPGLSHLSISGHTLDTRAVSELRGLASLQLMVADPPETDLSGLDSLRWYFGFLRGFESVFRAPNLEVAEFHEANDGSLAEVPRQLRGLTLHGARQVKNLLVHKGSQAPELRELHLHGCRHFDIRSLAAFPRLRTLTLEAIASVVEIASLTEMTVLEQLSILRCRSADGISSLAEVPGLKVLVVGELGESVRTSVEDANPPWTLLKRI